MLRGLWRGEEDAFSRQGKGGSETLPRTALRRRLVAEGVSPGCSERRPLVTDQNPAPNLYTCVTRIQTKDGLIQIRGSLLGPSLRHQQFAEMESTNSDPGVCKHQVTAYRQAEYILTVFLRVSFTEHASKIFR